MHLNQKYVFTGSRDETISILSGETFETLKTFEMKYVLPLSICRAVRAIDVKDNKLLIGTYGSEIYECSLSDVLINPNTVL